MSLFGITSSKLTASGWVCSKTEVNSILNRDLNLLELEVSVSNEIYFAASANYDRRPDLKSRVSPVRMGTGVRSIVFLPNSIIYSKNFLHKV